jgi:hypothetical protein
MLRRSRSGDQTPAKPLKKELLPRVNSRRRPRELGEDAIAAIPIRNMPYRANLMVDEQHRGIFWGVLSNVREGREPGAARSKSRKGGTPIWESRIQNWLTWWELFAKAPSKSMILHQKRQGMAERETAKAVSIGVEHRPTASY